MEIEQYISEQDRRFDLMVDVIAKKNAEIERLKVEIERLRWQIVGKDAEIKMFRGLIDQAIDTLCSGLDVQEAVQILGKALVQ
jgi:hypothetical protein